MRFTSSRMLGLCLFTALPSASAWADSTTETRLREALRAATAQVDALQDERAQWRVKEAQLQKELEALRNRPAPKVNCGNTTALNRELADKTTGIAKLMDALAACQATAPKAVPSASTTKNCAAEGEQLTRLTAEVTSLTKRLEASEARNAKLFKVGMEVVTWASNLKEVDLGYDFTQFKRVELENTAQDFEDKLLDQKSHP